MNVLAAIVAWAYAGHIQSANTSWDVWTQLRLSAQAGLPLAILALCLELAGRRRSWLAGGAWRSSR
jgi:hypothetical protein